MRLTEPLNSLQSRFSNTSLLEIPGGGGKFPNFDRHQRNNIPAAPFLNTASSTRICEPSHILTGIQSRFSKVRIATRVAEQFFQPSSNTLSNGWSLCALNGTMYRPV
jgi:hypothetical protein